MRCYKLVIGTGNNSLELSQDKDNPTGVNIQVNAMITALEDSTNTQVTVFNLPDQALGEYHKFYNQKIVLSAWLVSTPVTNKLLDYQNIKENKIVSGYITAVIGDPSSPDKPLTFIVQSYPLYLKDEFKKLETRTEKTAINMRIKKGDNPTPVISSVFDQITGGTVPLGIETQQTTFTPAYDDINVEIKTMSELYSQCIRLGYILYQNLDGFILYPTGTTSNGKKPFKITQTEFLVQPSALNESTLAITTRLRGDLRLFDRIYLPKDIYVSTGFFSSISNQSGNADYRNKSVYIWFSGTYYITKLWHVVDLYNSDPQAWATHMEVVKV